MKNFRCFLVVICLLMAAVPSFASDVTLFGGIQHQGKLTRDSAQQTASSFSFDPKNFGAFGLRVGGGKVVGGEYTIAYTPNFIASGKHALITNGNLLIQVPTPVVKPYATVGLGAFLTFGDKLFNGTSLDVGNKFAVNYGGGLKIMPKGPVGVRLDIRGYTLPSVEVTGLNISKQNLNIIEASVGVVFGF